jgi:hypothetical protein
VSLLVKKAKLRKVQPERFLIEMPYTSTIGTDCNPPCATARSFTNKVCKILCGGARVNKLDTALDVYFIKMGAHVVLQKSGQPRGGRSSEHLGIGVHER